MKSTCLVEVRSALTMKNVVKQDLILRSSQQASLKGHKSLVVWFTGLSGSGKTTLANALSAKLFSSDVHCVVLDGDNLRLGINSDLDFTERGRKENIRRVAEIAKLFIDAGQVVLASFVSPYIVDRNQAKRTIGGDNFIEVYVSTSIEECERRDVKGLYAKARSGKIKGFTGVDALYETPNDPHINLDTEKSTLEECTEKLYYFIQDKLKID